MCYKLKHLIRTHIHSWSHMNAQINMTRSCKHFYAEDRKREIQKKEREEQKESESNEGRENKMKRKEKDGKGRYIGE